ncbi:MAG TPA: hypothetical protein ENI23_10565 [bacterium]|nr:hypothetical protein [bacterium]
MIYLLIALFLIIGSMFGVIVFALYDIYTNEKFRKTLKKEWDAIGPTPPQPKIPRAGKEDKP